MTKPLPVRSKAASLINIEEIYRRHFDMVYRIGFSYLKNSSDAEDTAADVFALLMQKCIIFQNAEHEKAWLIRTSINTCKNHLKHWWRSRADIDDYENLHSDSTFHIDETLKTVMALPVRYKDVVYLYYYEGYTSKEIAGMLRKPHSTIRNCGGCHLPNGFGQHVVFAGARRHVYPKSLLYGTDGRRLNRTARG